MTVEVMLGGGEECAPTDDPCNGPLSPDAEYKMRYQLFDGDSVADYDFFEDTLSTSPTIGTFDV